MIVWIASHPRSGNTLARTILNRCFDVKSHSLYDQIESEGMAPIAGHLAHGMELGAFVAMASASDETFFIKTHELPSGDSHPAIYIVRDGRAALSSRRRYVEEIGKRIYPIEYLAIGAHPFVAWGDHVVAWLERSAGKLLLLRYEELSPPSAALLGGIAEFIGRPIVRDFDVTFAELRALNPTFFQVGHNERGINEIARMCPAIFWSGNGAVMNRLGYGLPPPELELIPTAALAEIRRAMLRTRRMAIKQRP